MMLLPGMALVHTNHSAATLDALVDTVTLISGLPYLFICPSLL